MSLAIETWDDASKNEFERSSSSPIGWIGHPSRPLVGNMPFLPYPFFEIPDVSSFPIWPPRLFSPKNFSPLIIFLSFFPPLIRRDGEFISSGTRTEIIHKEGSFGCHKQTLWAPVRTDGQRDPRSREHRARCLFNFWGKLRHAASNANNLRKALPKGPIIHFSLSPSLLSSRSIFEANWKEQIRDECIFIEEIWMNIWSSQ